MTDQSEKITIDYFSDILCVWAWVAQRRIDELNSQFADKIQIQHQYVDVFGDTQDRIQTQWSDKGLYEGFSRHVIKASAPYDTAFVSNEVWLKSKPSTSANAHLVIKAIELVHGSPIAISFAARLRKAFFVEVQDIGSLDVIYSIAMSDNLDINLIQNCISGGEAMAALMHDYQTARELGIKGSPCFVMNEGRQILFGNIGYRLLKTNVEELLKRAVNEASWC